MEVVSQQGNNHKQDQQNRCQRCGRKTRREDVVEHDEVCRHCLEVLDQGLSQLKGKSLMYRGTQNGHDMYMDVFASSIIVILWTFHGVCMGHGIGRQGRDSADLTRYEEVHPRCQQPSTTFRLQCCYQKWSLWAGACVLKIGVLTTWARRAGLGSGTQPLGLKRLPGGSDHQNRVPERRIHNDRALHYQLFALAGVAVPGIPT
jgi:ribosomal protein S14